MFSLLLTGQGSQQAIVVYVSGQSSIPYLLFSYSPPVVTGLTQAGIGATTGGM